MKKEWKVNANGNVHTIIYKAGLGNTVIVDKVKEKVKSTNWFINIIDHPINLGDMECRIVVIGNKADLVVNGFFQSNGKPYIPVQSAPKWVTILAVITTVIGGVISGIIGAAIGALCGSLYFSLALKRNSSYSIIAFVVVTILQILFFFGSITLYFLS